MTLCDPEVEHVLVMALSQSFALRDEHNLWLSCAQNMFGLYFALSNLNLILLIGHNTFLPSAHVQGTSIVRLFGFEKTVVL